jgi:hypothetical protein
VFLHEQLVAILAGETAIFGLCDNNPRAFTRALFTTWSSSQAHDRSCRRFHEDRTKHLECRTLTPYKYGYALGSRLLYPCPPRRAWGFLQRGRKKLAWPSGARARQVASVIEFELPPIRKMAFPFYARCKPLTVVCRRFIPYKRPCPHLKQYTVAIHRLIA